LAVDKEIIIVYIIPVRISHKDYPQGTKMAESEQKQQFLDLALRYRMMQIGVNDQAGLAGHYGLHPNTITNIKRRPTGAQRLLIDALYAFCGAHRTTNGSEPTP
jgi:hypothetical protein